tara:strand:+ start:1026 stop:1694 length:669 start_codon:yes stop_codon:yes gene_type:complete
MEEESQYRKEKGMHYFNFVMNDFFADTSYLNPLQIYTYFRLLCECYRSGESIKSNEITYYSRKFGVSKDDVELVLNDFFEVDKDNNYFQQRIQKTIDAYHSKQEGRSRGGKASAKKRKRSDYIVVESTKGFKSYLRGFVELFDSSPTYKNKGYQHAGHRVWKENNLEDKKDEVAKWIKKYYNQVDDMQYAKSFVTILKDGIDDKFRVESNASKYAKETLFIK